MKSIIELREEAIKEDKNVEFYLYQKLEEATEEIQRLNQQFTKGNELYDFIKKEMTFEEVMKLYRLLQEDIEGQIDISKIL